LEKQNHINIQDFLPHREPMLMVDRILEISKEEVITSFRIQPDNIFVDKRFLVESGLIENVAQTCSAITGQDFGDEIRNHEDPGSKVIGFITNIKKVKIHELPPVGSEIISKAQLNSQFGDICTISCLTYLEDRLLVEAEISLFIKAL